MVVLLAGNDLAAVAAVVGGKYRYVPSWGSGNTAERFVRIEDAATTGYLYILVFFFFMISLGWRVYAPTAGRHCGESECYIPTQFCLSSLADPVIFFIAQAKNAINQLSETELMGRPILVRQDRGDSGSHGHGVGGAAGAKVYVGNLSWEVQWQDLKDHMRTVGHTLRAAVE